MSSKNKYSELCRKSNDVHTELHNWKRKCTTIILNSSTTDHEVRYLHDLLSHHFPEVVASQTIHHGGMNGMTLVAPIEDVKAALELCLDMSPAIKKKYNDRIQCIIDNCKTGDTMKLRPDFN